MSRVQKITKLEWFKQLSKNEKLALVLVLMITGMVISAIIDTVFSLGFVVFVGCCYALYQIVKK